MRAMRWPLADAWAKNGGHRRLYIVGGSKKHGGQILGPTRARAAWLMLGVDGKTLAEAPGP